MARYNVKPHKAFALQAMVWNNGLLLLQIALFISFWRILHVQ